VGLCPGNFSTFVWRPGYISQRRFWRAVGASGKKGFSFFPWVFELEFGRVGLPGKSSGVKKGVFHGEKARSLKNPPGDTGRGFGEEG